MSVIRDRIVELRRVRASELRAHPRNWRMHPPAQKSALSSVLQEIGYADALVARRCADGVLELIDGHLRAETTPDVEVPVLVVDLDEREAALLLAVHDPLSSMAETDSATLHDLLSQVETGQADVAEILGELLTDENSLGGETRSPSEPTLADLFQVVVECRDERQQQDVFERMTSEGFRCRVLTL